MSKIRLAAMMQVMSKQHAKENIKKKVSSGFNLLSKSKKEAGVWNALHDLHSAQEKDNGKNYFKK